MPDGSPKRARARRLPLAAGLAVSFLCSFLAGMTDAIGFLAGGDFVSFMSGNTTQMAIAAAAGEAGTALRLAAILLAFVGGGLFGVLVIAATRASHSALLLFVALLLAIPAVPGLGEAAPVALAFAMGCLNVGLEEVAGTPLGVTYVTGALSTLGRGLGRLMVGRGSRASFLQLTPWSGMAAGALAGAVLQRRFGTDAVLASAALSSALAVVLLLAPRRWRIGLLAAPERPAEPSR